MELQAVVSSGLNKILLALYWDRLDVYHNSNLVKTHTDNLFDRFMDKTIDVCVSALDKYYDKTDYCKPEPLFYINSAGLQQATVVDHYESTTRDRSNSISRKLDYLSFGTYEITCNSVLMAYFMCS